MAFSFGTSANKPTLNLGMSSNTSTNTNNNTNAGSSFFNLAQPAASSQQQQQNSNTNNNNTQSTLGVSTSNPTSASNPQIDIAHLRSTTKWDHLTPQLQQEIANLDTAILNQIKQSSEVSDLIPSVINAGSQIAPGIEFVTAKLDELETGLENDAEAIVSLRDTDVRRDEGEAKCVFKAVDRLKVPRQYQVGHTVDVGANGAVFGGVGNGLSGWWNHPQTLRGSVRATGSGGQSVVHLVDEEVDGEDAGPKNLVTLFENRASEMEALSRKHRNLLSEIEDFIGGLEVKTVNKERELNQRLETGNGQDGDNFAAEERARQMQLLQYVFGEVQRNLYEVAEKVGIARDGIVDLGLRR